MATDSTDMEKPQEPSVSGLSEEEVGEMYAWVEKENIDASQWSNKTLFNEFAKYKNRQMGNDPSRVPTPPHNDKMANDYETFRANIAGVATNIDKVRKNVRYHINNPNLLTDLKLFELRRQLDEIEMRAINKDTREPHDNVRDFDVLPEPDVIVVDTLQGVAQVVDAVARAGLASPNSAPLLSLDCEGVDLGRNGSLTLLQLYVPREDHVYIIDIQTLGAIAFTTTGNQPRTTATDFEAFTNLKTILESSSISKVMWDCRADSDALFEHYNIELQGVIDAQLAANVVGKDNNSNKLLLSLDKGVSRRLNLPKGKVITIAQIKHIGAIAMEEGIQFVLNDMKRVGDEESGYSWISASSAGLEKRVQNGHAISAMAERPLHPIIIEYCAQDVLLLPRLLQSCKDSRFWSQEWADRVEEVSNQRLQEARTATYKPDPKTQADPPKGWLGIKRVDNTRL